METNTESTYRVSPVISIENISVVFDGFKALSNVTTEIMPNQVHFFIGPNGAGKTTLLDIICGKTKPTEGRVIYHGGEDYGNREQVNMDLTKMKDYDIVNAGIGRKFQAPSVYGSLSVYQNMELSLRTNKNVWATLAFKMNVQQEDTIGGLL